VQQDEKGRAMEQVLRRISQGDQWFRYWMPYQFVKLEHTKYKHVFLPVNRNYKPLGIVARDFLDYEKYMPQAVVFEDDPAGFKKIWWDERGLYLYDDGPKSRIDYFDRLGKLFLRSVRLEAQTYE
jgi:hypothetical protein